jgi:hypothetical protein
MAGVVRSGTVGARGMVGCSGGTATGWPGAGENRRVPSADVDGVVEGLAGRATWPYRVVAGWMHERPDLLPGLLAGAVDRLERSAPAVDAVVGLVGERVLAAEVEHAMTVLAGGMDPRGSQAAALVAAVSLQAPELLTTAHLGVIWDLGVNRSAYYASWPWRASTDQRERQRLLAVLQSGVDAEAARAAACLMQMGDVRIVREVQRIGVPGPSFRATDPRWVGFAAVAGDLVSLTPPGVYHLQFPGGVLRAYQWPGTGLPVPHPTWDLSPDAHSAPEAVRLGGTTTGSCPTCHGPVHRLLHLTPVPDDLGVSACPSLELATCLTCLGWAHPVIYTSHAPDGTVVQLLPDGPVRQEPPFTEEPLPETNVSLAVTPPRWRAQDWALSNGRENLNRLGGQPCWIQGADYPTCPACARTMTFLAQLDTLDFAEHGQWMWGSGGIAYLFWCDNCRHSAATWQCT